MSPPIDVNAGEVQAIPVDVPLAVDADTKGKGFVVCANEADARKTIAAISQAMGLGKPGNVTTTWAEPRQLVPQTAQTQKSDLYDKYPAMWAFDKPDTAYVPTGTVPITPVPTVPDIKPS